MTLQFDTRLFTLAKDPEQPGAYQDACCVDTEHHIAAIADGVSSALFSGPWAAILAEAVVAESPNPCDLEEFGVWLRKQRERWAASIDTSGLAWFQKAKLPRGAFSTLLYARVCEVENAQAGAFGGYRLVAFALGDSCLFQIRGGELVRSFPLETSDQFESDPIVLGSVDLKRDHLLEFALLDEMCYPGDELILCTDAVAEWAVRCNEHREGPVWSDFWQMSEDDWRSGVAWLRQQRQMRIDDATMLLLRVVDDRVKTHTSDEQPPQRSAEAASEKEAEESSPLAWLKSASKDLRSVSEQVAEQADQASERVLKGLRGLKERALKKYRETFGKKNDPPE
ncbi:MAG: protein phosphatase 2C domain-containing protein [Thermoguttaceae bacterium]